MQTQQQAPTPKQNSKKKKSGKYDEYTGAPDNAVYFLFDVETSGSKRNWDKIIAFSFLCFDVNGKQLGTFTKKINPGSDVHISSYLTRNIHGAFSICFDFLATSSLFHHVFILQLFHTKICAVSCNFQPWRTN